MKMYCYDCDKDVLPIKKRVKEHHSFRGKDFDTTMDLFYCPLCNGEIASEEKLNNQLAIMWNGYLNCFNLTLNSFKVIRTFITIIPPGVYLSDDAVKSFFGVDESSPYWDRMHKPSSRQRLVFDKCVIPITKRYKIEVTSFE